MTTPEVDRLIKEARKDERQRILTVLDEARDKMPQQHDKAIINQVIGYVKGSLSNRKTEDVKE